MPQTTPNIGLKQYDRIADKPEKFIDYRDAMAGTGSTSNMSIIDDEFGQILTLLENMQGTGWTSESLKANADAILSLKQKGVYTASTTGTNTLTATIADFTGAPPNSSTLVLVPSALNTTTVTLSVNGETSKPVNIARGKSGTIVYDVLQAKDLRPNVPVLVRKSSDGVRYVLINFGEDYARNVFYDNGDGTFESVQEKITTHLNAELPHIMDVEGTNYYYGLKQENGFVQFVYEEV